MKYMGSKARFAKEILSIVLKDRDGRDYIEPFAGGMNSICEVDPLQGKRYANDSNEYLIAMWKALQDGWVPPESVTREFYEECKKGNCEDHVRGYVGFNCSYSGKWFGGYAGKVKLEAATYNGKPEKGRLRDYQKEAYSSVIKQLKKLNGVVFTQGSYDSMEIVGSSVIYCDPPYFGTTKYKDDFEHSKFWEWVRKQSEFHSVYVSEYSAPEDFACVWEKQAFSSLSANATIGGRKSSTEKLFIYQP